MSRQKSIRKEGFSNYDNCFRENPDFQGKWHQHFGNNNPITIEVGCGKADLTIGIARGFPERNVIGIDLKSDRMWVAGNKAEIENLKNVAFLRTDTIEVADYFAQGEVDCIWVTFPDPYPKARHEKRRLTNKRFLDEYAKILSDDGIICFKTDNDDLFEYTLEHFSELGIKIIDLTRDLHGSEFFNEETGIITDYERRFMDMGQNINYLSFRP